jgi:hypothetical protein
MVPGLRLVVVACGLTLVASGCGGVSSRSYHGSAKGVSITLTVPGMKKARVGAEPRLAVHFTAAAGTVWRDALQVRKQEAFCIWPEKNGSGMTTIDVEIKSKRFALTFPSGSDESTGAYTCGLHARTGGAQGSWSAYVRAALVAARLRPVRD